MADTVQPKNIQVHYDGHKLNKQVFPRL